MQGAVRYALGIFYRLVPDFLALEWMYGVMGDLEKSVAFHRKSLAIDDPMLPCSNLMLAVALMCLAEDLEDEGEDILAQKTLEEGLNFLKVVGKSEAKFSVNSITCQKDSERLQRHHGDACGYSMARQQEKSPELD